MSLEELFVTCVDLDVPVELYLFSMLICFSLTSKHLCSFTTRVLWVELIKPLFVSQLALSQLFTRCIIPWHSARLSQSCPEDCIQTPQGRDKQSLWVQLQLKCAKLGIFLTCWVLLKAEEEHHAQYINWGKLVRRDHSLFISRQAFSQQVVSNFIVSHFFLLSFIPLSF